MEYRDGKVWIPFSEDPDDFATNTREQMLDLVQELFWDRIDSLPDGHSETMVGLDFYHDTAADSVLKRIVEAAPENAVFALSEDGLLVMSVQLPC